MSQQAAQTREAHLLNHQPVDWADDVMGFPYAVACKVTVVDLWLRTNWCKQNIGRWLVDWTHTYDNHRQVYWYCFSSQEQSTYFQLTWC